MAKYILLVYNDASLVDALAEGEYDTMMNGCFAHADELQASGQLLESQQLEPPATARTVRRRGGRTTVVDGPFTETKEVLGGFNLIEADNLEEAVRIAEEFPWVRTGCIEVRPVHDIAAERRRVGA